MKKNLSENKIRMINDNKYWQLVGPTNRNVINMCQRLNK